MKTTPITPAGLISIGFCDTDSDKWLSCPEDKTQGQDIKRQAIGYNKEDGSFWLRSFSDSDNLSPVIKVIKVSSDVHIPNVSDLESAKLLIDIFEL